MPNKLKSTRKRGVETIDIFMYIVSLLYPLTTLPQIIKVFSTHNVASLALASWIMYFVFQAVCVVYAISKRLLPLIIEGCLWLVYYGLIVSAILLFR